MARSSSKHSSLADDFGSLLADAQSLLEEAGKETGDKAQALRKQVESRLSDARLRLQQFEDDAAARARAASAATEDYVREHPWQTIGLVAATAFVAGLLLNRR